MRTIEVKEINVSTKQGRLDWLDYKNNPEWSFLAETGTIALFERVTEEASNCCSAKIIEDTDICSKCYEHCETINI